VLFGESGVRRSSLTVTPRANLVDQQTVEVDGSGFNPSASSDTINVGVVARTPT
jgi:hypothetical protein